VGVRFYNEKRTKSVHVPMVPEAGDRWQGTFPWKNAGGTAIVPPWAREAIVQVGMLGATGRLEVDDLKITSARRNKPAE
jgi:hypothetical protein